MVRFLLGQNILDGQLNNRHLPAALILQLNKRSLNESL